MSWWVICPLWVIVCIFTTVLLFMTRHFTCPADHSFFLSALSDSMPCFNTFWLIVSRGPLSIRLIASVAIVKGRGCEGTCLFLVKILSLGFLSGRALFRKAGFHEFFVSIPSIVCQACWIPDLTFLVPRIHEWCLR